MANLLHLRPILWVENIKATIDWYVNTLGFTESAYRGDLQWGEVRKGSVVIMFSTPHEHVLFSGSQFSGSFYFTTDDATTLWESLKNFAQVYYPLETFSYGMKEFAIKDCNGYILQFGQDVAA